MVQLNESQIKTLLKLIESADLNKLTAEEANNLNGSHFLLRIMV